MKKSSIQKKLISQKNHQFSNASEPLDKGRYLGHHKTYAPHHRIKICIFCM